MTGMALLSLIITMENGFHLGWLPRTHWAWIEHMLGKHPFVKIEYIIKVADGLISYTVSGGNKNLSIQKDQHRKEINI